MLELAQAGITAGAIYGGISSPDRKLLLNDIADGHIGLLYISPEQLRNPGIKKVLKLRDIGASAAAQYQGWRHSGALCVLTTPEGANLPATAAEENFPLLVRLNKDWFDFSQAHFSAQ